MFSTSKMLNYWSSPSLKKPRTTMPLWKVTSTSSVCLPGSFKVTRASLSLPGGKGYLFLLEEHFSFTPPTLQRPSAGLASLRHPSVWAQPVLAATRRTWLKTDLDYLSVLGVVLYCVHPNKNHRHIPCDKGEKGSRGTLDTTRTRKKWPLDENVKQSPRARVSHCLNWARDRRKNVLCCFWVFLPKKERL